MTDSIREQILTAIGDRLETILISNQYNSYVGQHVLRSHLPPVGSSIVPCVGYSVDVEENTALYTRKQKNVLPVRVQGVAEFGSVIPPVMAEKIYADICECMLADQFSIGFDSGGTSQILAGDTITGETSGAEALVISISLNSGTWAGGDAAGTFSLRRVVGVFQDNEDLSVGADTGQATVDGLLSGQGACELVTGGLADAISFYTGEITMPEADGIAIGVSIVFHIRYRLISGNPYSQSN